MSELYEDPLAGAEMPSQYTEAESEQLLLQLRELIADAPRMPLSASAMISKEEVLELLDEVIGRLPEELRASRWLLKEREEYLAKVQHEADEIIGQARARAERMVARSEVVKAAEHRAYEIVDRSEADARKLRHEVEDFCDQKLASFEIILQRTLTMVGSGRAKLQGTNLTAGIPVEEVDPHGAYEDEPGVAEDHPGQPETAEGQRQGAPVVEEDPGGTVQHPGQGEPVAGQPYDQAGLDYDALPPPPGTQEGEMPFGGSER